MTSTYQSGSSRSSVCTAKGGQKPKVDFKLKGSSVKLMSTLLHMKDVVAISGLSVDIVEPLIISATRTS